MLAGAVSFALMSLGFAFVAIPLAIAAFGAFFSTVFNWAATNNPDDVLRGTGLPPERIRQFIADAWSTFLPWMIGLIIVGIILWVLGYLLSLRILRSHRVNRPVAVTWSGLGIAVVGSWLLSALGSPFSGLASMWTPDVGQGRFDPNALTNFDFTPVFGLGAIFFLIALVANAAIGLLSWWWMAHAFRERHTPIDDSATAQTVTA
jgi:hypothetical protein